MVAGFRKGATRHCYTQNNKAKGYEVSEKKIYLCFSNCKSMEANDPQGEAIFYPRGITGRIYVGYY